MIEIVLKRIEIFNFFFSLPQSFGNIMNKGCVAL